MRRLKLTITIVLAAVWFQGFSQQAEAWMKTDSSAIMLGDQIGLELGVKLPEKAQVQWPLITDTITSHIDVVKQNNIDTTINADQKILTQRLIITSFDSGYFELPPVHFIYRMPGDTTLYNVGTGSIYLQVYVPEVDTAQPFKAIVAPIDEPYTLGEILPWVLLGLAVIAGIIFLIVWWNRRRKNQPLFKSKPKPLLPPDVEAINKLEDIRLARIWQSGKVKQYFSSLTDVMRNYLKRRYGFDATEMTTDEIMDELKNHLSNPGAIEKLKGMMQLADLVKFAKAQPTPLENDLSLDHCLDFVKETRPVVAEPKEEEKTNVSEKKDSK